MRNKWATQNAKCSDTKRLDQESSLWLQHEFVAETKEGKMESSDEDLVFIMLTMLKRRGGFEFTLPYKVGTEREYI